MNYGVVLFHTTTSALRSEKILKGTGLEVKLIPTPRELSSDCGIALRFSQELFEQVKIALEGAKIEFEIYRKLS